MADYASNLAAKDFEIVAVRWLLAHVGSEGVADMKAEHAELVESSLTALLEQVWQAGYDAAKTGK